MKRRLLFAALILILCFGMFGCGETYDSLAEDQATIENPADPTEKVTIEDWAGVFSIQLDNTYVGDAATDYLVSIGENEGNFANDVEGYKLVVQEYTVTTEEGYEEEPFYYADVIGAAMWDVDHESKYEFAVYDLYENASLDYYQLEMGPNETSKMYFVFEIEEDVDEFISGTTGYNRDFWFIYDVSE